MKFDWEETIVGLATPVGHGSRAILRLAGPRSHEVAASLSADPVTNLPWTQRGIRAMPIRITSFHSFVPCILYHWPRGASATGQEMAELHLPAGPVLVDEVEKAIRSLGVRGAQPGEFTLRAFLAGRLDLAQAEGVLGLIEAENIVTLRTAIDQRAGGQGQKILALRQRLLDLLADLEAGLDFVEEDISFITEQEILDRIKLTQTEIGQIIQQFSRRQSARPIPRVLLLGPPNAGKSSLLNALADQSHAIVSDVAGTTRDWISARIIHHDRSWELIDTAGIDDPQALFHAETSIQRDDLLSHADLVIWCQELEQPLSIPTHLDKPLIVRTKGDLGVELIHGELVVSALTHRGLDRLRDEIARRLAERDSPSTGSLTPRVADALDRAQSALSGVQSALESGIGQELLAMMIRDVLDPLGEIVGEVYTDDLLDRIFSKFCIGK
jgi:tRNA modification GTPase